MSGTGASGSSPFNFNTSFSDLNTGLFGNDSTTSGTSNLTRSGTTTRGRKVNQEGIVKMIDDILQSNSGLASIFGLEQGVGLNNSSVATDETTKLLSAIAGELGKLTATEVETVDLEDTQTTSQKTESDGLVDQAGDFLSGVGDFLGF